MVEFDVVRDQQPPQRLSLLVDEELPEINSDEPPLFDGRNP